MDEGLVQLAKEAFALFDKNNSGNIDQKVSWVKIGAKRSVPDPD
jgi:hypothetical protein